MQPSKPPCAAVCAADGGRHIQRVSGDCGTHPLPSLPYQRGNNVPTFGPSPCRSERPKFLRSGLYRRGGVPGERTFEGLQRLLQRRRAVYSVRTAGKSVAGAMLIWCTFPSLTKNGEQTGARPLPPRLLPAAPRGCACRDLSYEPKNVVNAQREVRQRAGGLLWYLYSYFSA